MKKRQVVIAVAGIIAAGIVLAGCSKGSGSSPENEGGAGENASFVPENTVTFHVSSTAGGNSDLFGRTIADICTKEGLVDPAFIVNNNTDGSGNIVRIETRDSDDPDHTLLVFNSGDVKFTLDSDVGLSMDDFAPIAVLAADKQLLFAKADGNYTSFEKVLEAVEKGTKLNVGGTKTNELTSFNMFSEEIGYSEMFNYMLYNASNESITALLGDHLDLAMGSPGTAIPYVESGDIIPIVAFSDERFMAPLDEAPTMEELGYQLVQSPMWRGVLASADMSEEAQKFWNETFKKVTETEAWQDYLNTTLLSPYYNDLESSRKIVEETTEAYYAEQAAEN